jgi:hypothetical protein
MTPRQSGDDVFLTGEDAAFIRQALCACSQTLAWIRKNGGPQGKRLLAEAALAADGTALGRAEYDANLAIDHIDFPRKAGQGR